MRRRYTRFAAALVLSVSFTLVAAGNLPCLAREEQPSPNSTWYLAEGTTALESFYTSVNIENPNPEAVTARVTYMLPTGPVARPDVTLPPMSRTTLSPEGDIGRQDFSTKVECVEGEPIAVDRTMRWYSGYGNGFAAHCSIGVTSPSREWYMPEGSSNWGFECFVMVQNPNTSAAQCAVTYMIEGAGPVTVHRTVPPNARATWNMKDDIGAGDASILVEAGVPVVCERSMYLKPVPPSDPRGFWREGHNSVGAVAPAGDYYLAEGSTNWGFTTYVLVQNPNDVGALVSVEYQTSDGLVADSPFMMPAKSRKTIRVNDNHPGLDFSTHVHADVPIVAERAMYWWPAWDSPPAMHDSIGISGPHSVFYLPEGEVFGEPGDDYYSETFTLVQNPNDAPVEVRVSYLTDTGQGNVVFADTVPGNSRRTYDMEEWLTGQKAAILVESLIPGMKVIAERSTYYDERWAGACTIGGYAD